MLRRDRSARVIHDHTVSGIRDWRKFSRKTDKVIVEDGYPLDSGKPNI